MDFQNNSLSKISENIFHSIQQREKYNPEYQYLNLIDKILANGFWEEGRNGRTKSVFGENMRFSLQNGQMPILTTKKTAWKTCLKELLWFIRGETDNKILQQQNVHIWDQNASHEFMNSRGLGHYPEGILGPLYGYQWRNFNAPYDYNKGTPDFYDWNETEGKKGIDQLQFIIDSLKDPVNRYSRRLIMTAWNPCQLHQMALPPCHILCQFNVHDDNKLSCALYQRSADVMLGMPFNIASYSFLTHLIAKHCGLEAYEFVYFCGNCHIYEQHIEAAELQVDRTPFDFPILEIFKKNENINYYDINDFAVSNYISHDVIKMKMIA